MVNGDLTQAFKAYVSDKETVCFAEIQYNLKISYTLTKELYELAQKNKWIAQVGAEMRVNQENLTPEKFNDAKCRKVAKLMDAPKLDLMDKLIECGSMSRDEARKFLRNSGQMRFISETSIDFLLKQGIAQSVDGMLYPLIDKQTAGKIRDEYNKA